MPVVNSYALQQLQNTSKQDKEYFVASFVREQRNYAVIHAVQGREALLAWNKAAEAKPISSSDIEMPPQPGAPSVLEAGFGTPILQARVSRNADKNKKATFQGNSQPIPKTVESDARRYAAKHKRALSESPLAKSKEKPNKKGGVDQAADVIDTSTKGVKKRKLTSSKKREREAVASDDEHQARLKERRERKRAKKTVVRPKHTQSDVSSDAERVSSKRNVKDKKSRRSRIDGLALMHGFHATNVGKNRLTVSARPIGVFIKGKASAKTDSITKKRAANIFSEFEFLNPTKAKNNKKAAVSIKKRQPSSHSGDSQSSVSVPLQKKTQPEKRVLKGTTDKQKDKPDGKQRFRITKSSTPSQCETQGDKLPSEPTESYHYCGKSESWGSESQAEADEPSRVDAGKSVWKAPSVVSGLPSASVVVDTGKLVEGFTQNHTFKRTLARGESPARSESSLRPSQSASRCLKLDTPVESAPAAVALSKYFPSCTQPEPKSSRSEKVRPDLQTVQTPVVHSRYASNVCSASPGPPHSSAHLRSKTKIPVQSRSRSLSSRSDILVPNAVSEVAPRRRSVSSDVPNYFSDALYLDGDGFADDAAFVYDNILNSDEGFEDLEKDPLVTGIPVSLNEGYIAAGNTIYSNDESPFIDEFYSMQSDNVWADFAVNGNYDDDPVHEDEISLTLEADPFQCARGYNNISVSSGYHNPSETGFTDAPCLPSSHHALSDDAGSGLGSVADVGQFTEGRALLRGDLIIGQSSMVTVPGVSLVEVDVAKSLRASGHWQPFKL
ncbi:hypothetical protein FISHEDRAFT_70580 [Fistulina hepatica ATCC 64428]|uniref:Uncharacterized protein n=1 Tax=Fistulina hepatica ATCC 64428 TaxID=1128425 RepID=A0A0D7AIL9_9AGAR|nr:hypothetical protein FISHEDRAFT_70580 [Fistulina hepatica ATCC 64428]